MNELAAISATIGVIASIIFSRLSYKNTLKTIEQHESLEQKKIKADTVSKSRIAWIKDVRELTANIINILLSFEDIEKKDLKLEYELRKEIELLKLYFSSHTDKDEKELSVSELKEKLLNKNGNSNKNRFLIQYIDKLYTTVVSTTYIKKIK